MESLKRDTSEDNLGERDEDHFDGAVKDF